MSLPHDGPTVDTLTLLVLVLASLARVLRTSSTLLAEALGASTRMSWPIVWILVAEPASAPSAALAWSTDTPGAATCHDTPPTKSMPRFRPRAKNDPMLMSIRTADTTRARRHHLGKPMSFWPR